MCFDGYLDVFCCSFFFFFFLEKRGGRGGGLGWLTDFNKAARAHSAQSLKGGGSKRAPG